MGITAYTTETSKTSLKTSCKYMFEKLNCSSASFNFSKFIKSHNNFLIYSNERVIILRVEKYEEVATPEGHNLMKGGAGNICSK